MASTGKLDGYPVELYDGSFSGKFEMTEEDGKRIGYDDVVSFLVVATADKANFDTTKGGEVRRTNRLTVNEVMLLEHSVARDLMASAGRLESQPGEETIEELTLREVREAMAEFTMLDDAFDVIEDFEEVFSPGGYDPTEFVEGDSSHSGVMSGPPPSALPPQAPSKDILNKFLEVS